MTVLNLCHSEEAQRADVGIRPFLRWTGVRAAEVVGPYGRSTEVPATGRCGHRPLRVVAESCRDHPGSALSAERAAGQIQVLPDDLRVQHGAQRSEVSARPRPCSRRGCVDWAERFRAASRCAGGRSAPVTAQRKAFFLLTAPPPFSFWRSKKKMGVESHRPSPVPPVGQPASTAGCA